jgi:hypothetical protein
MFLKVSFMLLIHESEVIPENLSWDESCEVIQQHLSDNHNVHYCARPRESFSLKEAAAAGYQHDN